MAMLTVNANDHPFMRRFHAPGEEKRMVVILEPKDFEGWLPCPADLAKGRYCKQWTGQLVGGPAPLPGRGSGAVRASRAKPKEPLTGDLFFRTWPTWAPSRATVERMHE